MSNLIDDIFEDFVEGDEDLRDFHSALSEILPNASITLLAVDGTKVASPLQPIADEIVAHCKEQLGASSELASCPLDDGQLIFGKRLDELGGCFLCLCVSGQDVGKAVHQQLLPLYQNSINYALLQCTHRDAVIDNEQINRRIEVLTTNHAKLLDDNHKQFLLIQQKEHEYAKKLESEIARQTRELRETNVRLEEASRLKSEFLANMSHELRTPMNAIIGFGGLLIETELTEEQQEFTETIRKAAAGLLVLINDILDLAKIEAGKLDIDEEPFCLDGLGKSVEAMFRSQALEKGNKLSYRLDPALPHSIIGDENRLRQIMVNLVGNAMKFTENGEVTIFVDLVSQAADKWSIKFGVSDTGIGIPPERQKAIFEKFTQADGSTTRKFGGTGLGLSITNQLVGLMGGAVELESEAGKGSVFSFVLDLTEAATAASAAGKNVDQVGGNGADLSFAQQKPAKEITKEAADFCVLVVEDNLVNQRLAALLLKKAGCKTDLAGDGLQALEKIQDKFYDLILMDVQMPNMDGHTATREIRKIENSAEKEKYKSLAGRKNGIAIVGLTAHARKEDEQRCYEAGMDGFLTKPIVRATLVSLLEEMKTQKKNHV